MKNKLKFSVTPELAGTRLDKALARWVPDLSRSFLQKLTRDGCVTNGDGEPLTTPRAALKLGGEICVEVPEAETVAPVEAEEFKFRILFEDDEMLIIDKPAGVVVHPAVGNHSGTVVNALLSRYPTFAKNFADTPDRPGIVHRLDKDTSGCLVIAKTPTALFKLGTAFAERKIHKTYRALVRGEILQNRGNIVTNIGRHPVNRQKMAVVDRGGKEAITDFTVLRRGWLDRCPVAELAVEIATGRTHQIRVHMAYLKLPVLGDEVYGGNLAARLAPRQMLHAWKISVPHPTTGEIITVKSELPDDYREITKQAFSVDTPQPDLI